MRGLTEDRRRLAGLVAVALFVLLDIVLVAALFLREDGESTAGSPGERAERASAPRDPDPSGGSASSDEPTPAPESPTLVVTVPAETVPAYTTVPVRGRYAGAEPGTRIHLERRDGSSWVRFPVPAATRSGGRWSTFVELGEPGAYELRAVDPRSGITSEVVTLTTG